jgi:hypothetical protein
MSILLKQFGKDVALRAQADALYLISADPIDWSHQETWPPDTREQSSGRRTAFEAASLLEMGLANVTDGALRIPYGNFPEIEAEEFRLATAFAEPSPFLLKIDRTSDIGRPDFKYRYQYVLGSVPVPLQRIGFYVKRTATGYSDSTRECTVCLKPWMRSMHSPQKRRVRNEAGSILRTSSAGPTRSMQRSTQRFRRTMWWSRHQSAWTFTKMRMAR